MAPSHAGPAPIAARNAGRMAVAVSWLQSLKRLVRPTPRTVRLSQDCLWGASAMGKQFTVESSQLEVQKTRLQDDLDEAPFTQGQSLKSVSLASAQLPKCLNQSATQRAGTGN